MTFEPERWAATWARVGGAAPEGLLAALAARHAEPHRHYHSLEHLRECFAGLDASAHLAERSAEVELALWFHDAIYDPRAHDNEEQSARWAERSLLEGGVGREIAGRVRDLVLATRHDAAPAGADATLLVDIDLSILGAPPARFDAYEVQVRQEYAWVDEGAFREGRARILRAFLGRPAIYGTAWFAERLEVAARENLRRSLQRLAGAPDTGASPS